MAKKKPTKKPVKKAAKKVVKKRAVKAVSKEPIPQVKTHRKSSAKATLLREAAQTILDGLHKYFRLEVEGIEHIPKHGPIIVAPNHSGFSGFDAVILARAIVNYKRRLPKIMIHKLWFFYPGLGDLMRELGFFEATAQNAVTELEKGRVVIMFPEGEEGNFKTSFKKYELREFKTGFARLSLLSRAPVIPCLIIGAEETHLTLKQFRWFTDKLGIIIPLPLNIIPLPAKWKIIFYPPMYLPYSKDQAHDRELLVEIAEDLREKMQKQLNVELRKRPNVFF